jgi:hypothetical protein
MIFYNKLQYLVFYYSYVHLPPHLQGTRIRKQASPSRFKQEQVGRLARNRTDNGVACQLIVVVVTYLQPRL